MELLVSKPLVLVLVLLALKRLVELLHLTQQA